MALVLGADWRCSGMALAAWARVQGSEPLIDQTGKAAEPSAGPLRVLFVDDEPHILNALSNSLRRYRTTWNMAFVNGGQAARQHLDLTPVDVVVSDARMPEVDGEAVLLHAQAVQPRAARIILSGQTDARATKRLVNLAHQFLAKPSDAETIAQAVNRVGSVVRRLHSPELEAVLGRVGQLPASPSVWRRLTELFDSRDASLQGAARIIETDPALSVKVLQVINSAFFGLPQRMTSVATAVTRLGFEPLRGLVLWQETTNAFGGGSVEQWQGRAFRVGSIARTLMGKHPDRDTAFTAGLLCDLGVLALATALPELGVSLELSMEERCRQEIALTGITHAAVGAHLLALWGLPPSLVSVVASHHDDASTNATFDLSTAVWLADSLVEAADAKQLTRQRQLVACAETWGIRAELNACLPSLGLAATKTP